MDLAKACNCTTHDTIALKLFTAAYDLYNVWMITALLIMVLNL